MTMTLRGLARLKFTVNGRRHTVEAPPMKRLLDVLREECGLTGTKEGCGEGECGACTVLMNGITVNSCLVPVLQADGAKVVTVEGLASGRALSALQQAFVELGGAQCGICTPGMLISAHELLLRANGRVPGDAEVRDALAGNLCRCTGYQKIVDAVRAAARTATAGRTSGTARAKKESAASGKPAKAKASPVRARASAGPKKQRGVAKPAATTKRAQAAGKKKAAARRGAAGRHK